MTPLKVTDASPASHSVAKLGSLDFWRSFAPDFHIADPSYLSGHDGITLSPAQQERVAAQIRDDGYVQASVDWGLDFARMADAVRALSAAGLSPAFAYLYDEFWIPFYRLHFIISGLLGGSYVMLPDFWVWNVEPAKGDSGWKPHRDRGYQALLEDRSAKSVTAWIPLSRATPLNSCMYIVPATLDPTYGTKDDWDWKFEYPSIRALPAQPGDFLIWNQAVLHWGSKSSPLGDASRVSMAFEFQRADIEPFNNPVIAPLSILPFERRLQLIAKQILQYWHMYTVDPHLKEFAQSLQPASELPPPFPSSGPG